MRIHLGDIDDILVMECKQDVDLSDGGQWEALGLSLHLDLLQGKDLPALPLPRPAHRAPLSNNNCERRYLLGMWYYTHA